MANVPHMRLVWQWRREILAGRTVKEIAQGSGKGYSETTIRNYTKAERAKMRELEKERKEQERLHKLLKLSNEAPVNRAHL